MTWSLRCSAGSPPSYRIVDDPRERWPREDDFVRWLAGNLDRLAACLGMRALEYTGREVRIGDQVLTADALGRWRWTGGLRMDLTARDERGRFIVVEAQFGEGDHEHMGKLLTYACGARADVVVWIVVGENPMWQGMHLEALAELNERFAGDRHFCAVAVTVESPPSIDGPPWDAPRLPRFRQVDLASCTGRPSATSLRP